MRLLMPGDFSQFTEPAYFDLDPRYWLLKSPGRWLIYIFILQAFIYYSMPYFLSIFHPETILGVKESLIRLMGPDDEYMGYINSLSPPIILSGFIFWLLFIPEIVAIYFMVTGSGRDLAMPSALNKTNPDMRVGRLHLDEMFMDRRKYIGPVTSISLTRRLVGSFFAVVLGLLVFWKTACYPSLNFSVPGMRYSPHNFENLFIAYLAGGVFVIFAVIAVRDFVISIRNTFKED